MKFIVVKFFVEAALPSRCCIIESGGNRSAFSAVQGARGSHRPATRIRPLSSFSPRPPSAAASVAASSAAAVSTSSTPASTALSQRLAKVNAVSTTNMPPLPNTGTHPGQNGSDFLDDNVDDSLDGNGDTEVHRTGLFSNHNGEGDYGVEEFPVKKRVIHFLGERIDARNRMNVEICILIEAGTSVSNERSTTTVIQHRMMLDRYVNLVRQFDSDDFASSTL